jgi:hypothetical protein
MDNGKGLHADAATYALTICKDPIAYETNHGVQFEELLRQEQVSSPLFHDSSYQ